MEAIGTSKPLLSLNFAQALISDLTKQFSLLSKKVASTSFSTIQLADKPRKFPWPDAFLRSFHFCSVQIAYTEQERLIGDPVRF